MACSTGDTALVLAGGGARGAYEAGVLSYILRDLQRETGVEPCLDLFSGTSVGALNCSFLASSIQDPELAGRSLWDYWWNLSMDRILRFGLTELNAFRNVLMARKPARSADTVQGLVRHPPVRGIFDTSPLYRDMQRLVRWGDIGRNLESGRLKGIAVCATEVCRGKTVYFYQMSEDRLLVAGDDPGKEARRVEFSLDHAMASAAMPMLFPSIQVDGFCYSDGGLRQNTPVYPALRMGAEKLLVVSLTQDPKEAFRTARLSCRRNPHPGLLFLIGRMVNALLSESLDYDLNRVHMFNSLLDAGTELYGDTFTPDLNRIAGRFRQAEYRQVRTCMIRPSRDLNELAFACLDQAPDELRLPGIPGRMLHRFLLSPAMRESDLLSFLMFTPTYTRRLLELGRDDARNRRSDLETFFGV